VSNDNLKIQLDNVTGKSKSVFSLFNLHRFTEKVNDNLEKYNYCLFLGTILEYNIERLSFLYNLKVSFCVRKHPRDKFSYEDKFRNLFISRNVQDLELFRLFNYGITGASGIVDVLISNSKPFYLLKGDYIADFSAMPYFRNGYYGNINSIKNLESSLDSLALINSFESYYPSPRVFNLAEFYNKVDSI
jgi:hypothetical protein